MRFYAVRTEAIHHTHQALQRLRQGRCGSGGPSRALRVAQLYGYLQCHANAAGELQLALRDLAAAWHLQPRQLRDDLHDLQALGWLRYEGLSSGTRIRLRRSGLAAEAPAPAASDPPPVATPAGPEAQESGARELIDRFSKEYNRRRPSTWPAYSPRGIGLAGRLRRAIAQAGGAEPFWQTLRQALAAMPAFWRDTYPQGRSGADCVAALLSTDRQGAGLGVEFWHVFRWAALPGAETAAPAAATAAGATAGAMEEAEDLLRTARSLLAWDGHHWRGQGIAAAELSRAEKLRYALALEAAGIGEAGAAESQYGSGEQPAAEAPAVVAPWG